VQVAPRLCPEAFLVPRAFNSPRYSIADASGFLDTFPMSEPNDGVLRLTTPTQLKGLAHPMRERLMMNLNENPVTISQLARALGVAKGTVAYHLRVMRDAGLVKVVKRRRVRGGTEQYYQVAAARIEFPGVPPAAPMLGAVADLDAAEEVPVLVHHAMHLNAAEAEQLIAAMNELDELAHHHGMTNSGTDGPPRYGVLLGFYRYRRPDTNS
jgi:DNA-binding transcriptional ArsR family regulator